MKLLARDPKTFGRIYNGKVQFLDRILNDPARMRWILHLHGDHHLMVVDKIEIKCLAALETKNDPPVRTHSDGPKALEIAAKCVQSIPGHIDPSDIFSCVNHTKKVFDPLDVLGIEKPSLSGFKQ